jgi:hypothetical protein
LNLALDMENAPRPTWKTRLVKERFPGRDFDTEQGDEAIFRPPGRWSNWRNSLNMVESPHHTDLLQLFNDCQVEYLVVRGYAVMKYSELRYA